MRTVNKVGGTNGTTYTEFYGNTTDVKPTADVPNGSAFYEVDNNMQEYRFDKENKIWYPITRGGTAPSGDYLPLSGGIMTGDINMNGNSLLNAKSITLKDETGEYTVKMDLVNLGAVKPETGEPFFYEAIEFADPNDNNKLFVISGVADPLLETDAVNLRYLGENYIPLTGTKENKPVTGSIVVSSVNEQVMSVILVNDNTDINKVTSETTIANNNISIDGYNYVGFKVLGSSQGVNDISFYSVDKNDKHDGIHIVYNTEYKYLSFDKYTEDEVLLPVLMRGADTPVEDNDISNKKYVDDSISTLTTTIGDNYIPLTGTVADKPVTGDIVFDGTHTVTGVKEPENDTDVVTKKYVDVIKTDLDDKTNQLKENLTKISEQKAYMDGVMNLFNWVRGGYTVASNRLAFNADNEYAIATPATINVNNASYIEISDFETYKYSLAVTYGTDNWFYLNVTSNPFEIPKNVTGLVVSVGRRDNIKIMDSDLTSVSCTIISDSKFKHLVALTELFSMPKKISVIENTQTNTVADAFLLNENISMDTNNAKGLFSKKIGGTGSITFTDWLPTKQLSNTFNVQQDDDYIYKCMHFPHDGTYPNLQYQDPNIIDVEPLPFKLSIGAIYVNTDVAEEFNGIVRIVACNLFGYKKGYWYEIDNSSINWAQIYSLPWGTSGGTNVPIIYQNGTVLIDLKNNKLTKDNTLHFGTSNTYATEFDYYIVKVIVRCNKNSCGLKIGVDSRDNISGSPTQIINSRTFALTANTTLTAFAHNIPDSVYSNVIVNFDNYIKLKVPHYYCGQVKANGFIINLLKDKKSVTNIKDLDSGEETKIIINDGSVNTSSNNNLIIVTERDSRIEVTAKKDIFLNVIVSDTDAIANYNFDLI